MSASNGNVVRLRPLGEVLDQLEDVKRSSGGHRARCPAHDDRKPSLSIWVKKGQIRFKCMAGCTEDVIAKALGIEPGQRVSGAKPTTDRPPPPPLNAKQVAEWHAALLKDPDAMRYVTQGLGFTRAVVVELNLGFSSSSFTGERRLWYPYRSGNGWSHANGRALDDREPKYKCEPSKQPPRIYRGETLTRDGVAVLFEGERDVASALSIKLASALPDSPSIVGLSGVGQAKRAAEELAGQRLIYLATDADDAGDRAADELASHLGPERCRRVRLDGFKDLGDLLAAVGPKKALAAVLNAVDKAERLEVQPQAALSDAGNAERFALQHSERTRFVHGGWNRWHVWDGRRWAPDVTGSVMQLAILTARTTLKEAAEATTLEERSQLSKFAIKSESHERLKAMVAIARSHRRIATTPESFDMDPFVLNLPNGTLDLRTGKLLTHDSARLLTKLASVNYDPKATAPIFKRFIERVVPDRTVRDYLQRAIGYSLSASVDEQCIFFCHGAGANGKSTLLETVRELLGGDYAKTVTPDLLMSKQHEQHEEQIAELQGTRFVLAPEVEQGRFWNEAKLKWLTGGDHLTARFMYGSRFNFAATHKFWVLGNHKPHARGADHGFWRRIHLIPFDVLIPEKEKDPQLKEKLKARELPGILKWAVDGAIAWRTEGLRPPKAVLSATEAYRSNEDVITAFIQERCERVPSERIKFGDLFATFDAWVTKNNERRISKREFGNKLDENRSFERRKSHGENYVMGLTILSERFSP